SPPPMTSGSKSVLFGISSISSRAVVVFPAPNAPLIQTITDSPSCVGPLRLARSTLPRKPAPVEGAHTRAPVPRSQGHRRRTAASSAVLPERLVGVGEAVVADRV